MANSTGNNSSLNIVALAVTIFGSLLASYATIEVLFTITNHTELWIFFFTQVTILVGIAVALYNYVYEEKYRTDLWWQVRQSFHVFVLMFFVMTVVRLVVSFLLYAIEISPMRIADYINIFLITVFVIFVLFTKFQVFLS